MLYYLTDDDLLSDTFPNIIKSKKNGIISYSGNISINKNIINIHFHNDELLNNDGNFKEQIISKYINLNICIYTHKNNFDIIPPKNIPYIIKNVYTHNTFKVKNNGYLFNNINHSIIIDSELLIKDKHYLGMDKIDPIGELRMYDNDIYIINNSDFYTQMEDFVLGQF